MSLLPSMTDVNNMMATFQKFAM